MEKEKHKELAAKYNVDLGKAKKEQERLSKNLEIVNGSDEVRKLGGIYSAFAGNKIVSAVVVIEEGEIVDEEYFIETVKFPYIPEFRSYRELPSMVQAFNKLRIKPDVIFVNSHGILHPRSLGLASHLSLSINLPTIGVADKLIFGKEEDDKILVDSEVRGKVVKTKEGAKPLIVSPGNKISLELAENLVRKFTFSPHKIPEPLHKARKYAKNVRKEMLSW